MVARVQWILYFLLILVLFEAGGTALMVQADQDLFRGRAMAQLPELVPESHKDLGLLILSNYHEYRSNTVRWSFAYYTCLFGAAALSAFAALILTLSTVGNFQEKWQANRMAAGSMENLAYDLLKEGPDHERRHILSRIQDINRLRNLEITGQENRKQDSTETGNN